MGRLFCRRVEHATLSTSLYWHPDWHPQSPVTFACHYSIMVFVNVHQTTAYSKNQQTWKKQDNCKNNGKTKKQISKIQKTQKQKSKGEKEGKKGKSKREKMGNQWTCPFACFLLSWFVFFGFYFAFSLFFTGKKAKQNGQ